jgi:hypothetical protein
MKLGLTIIYRLLWTIQLACCCGAGALAVSDEQDVLWGVIGLFGFAVFLQVVFIHPIGLKLAEKPDEQ